MGNKTIVVWSCGHADPDASNERFTWLGKFLFDIKPDLAIDLGDGADMRSLNSYDTRYPQKVVNQSYEEDIESYIDSQERLRQPFKASKKKKPFWVGFEGNHENRIKKALAEDPRLEGKKYGISFGHLQTREFFTEYHQYRNSAPGIADYLGIDFAHYFASGNSPAATSGLNHAHSLINNRHKSSICGHSHKRNLYFKDGPGSIGLVVGCYKGQEESWAGQSNQEWWKGVVVLRDVSNGRFEPQFVSMSMLEKEYA
jgi:hypothetical protein